MDITSKYKIDSNFKIIPSETKKAFVFLSEQPWFANSHWYLAGGTALALQVGNRKSVDLDFFTTEKDFDKALKEIKETIENKVLLEKAEELALTLSNKIPVILTYSPLTAVAKRWVNQLNENSKTFAASFNFPEACHNFIVGLEFPTPEKICILFLESNYAFSRNIARQKIIHELVDKKEIAFLPLSVRSGNFLTEQLLFIYFGDLLSYYLAGVYGVDPTPIESINFLKEQLKKV